MSLILIIGLFITIISQETLAFNAKIIKKFMLRDQGNPNLKINSNIAQNGNEIEPRFFGLLNQQHKEIVGARRGGSLLHKLHNHFHGTKQMSSERLNDAVDGSSSRTKGANQVLVKQQRENVGGSILQQNILKNIKTPLSSKQPSTSHHEGDLLNNESTPQSEKIAEGPGQGNNYSLPSESLIRAVDISSGLNDLAPEGAQLTQYKEYRTEEDRNNTIQTTYNLQSGKEPAVTGLDQDRSNARSIDSDNRTLDPSEIQNLTRNGTLGSQLKEYHHKEDKSNQRPTSSQSEKDADHDQAISNTLPSDSASRPSHQSLRLENSATNGILGYQLKENEGNKSNQRLTPSQSENNVEHYQGFNSLSSASFSRPPDNSLEVEDPALSGVAASRRSEYQNGEIKRQKASQYELLAAVTRRDKGISSSLPSDYFNKPSDNSSDIKDPASDRVTGSQNTEYRHEEDISNKGLTYLQNKQTEIDQSKNDTQHYYESKHFSGLDDQVKTGTLDSQHNNYRREEYLSNQRPPSSLFDNSESVTEIYGSESNTLHFNSIRQLSTDDQFNKEYQDSQKNAHRRQEDFINAGQINAESQTRQSNNNYTSDFSSEQLFKSSLSEARVKNEISKNQENKYRQDENDNRPTYQKKTSALFDKHLSFSSIDKGNNDTLQSNSNTQFHNSSVFENIVDSGFSGFQENTYTNSGILNNRSQIMSQYDKKSTNANQGNNFEFNSSINHERLMGSQEKTFYIGGDLDNKRLSPSRSDEDATYMKPDVRNNKSMNFKSLDSQLTKEKQENYAINQKSVTSEAEYTTPFVQGNNNLLYNIDPTVYNATNLDSQKKEINENTTASSIYEITTQTDTSRISGSPRYEESNAELTETANQTLSRNKLTSIVDEKKEHNSLSDESETKNIYTHLYQSTGTEEAPYTLTKASTLVNFDRSFNNPFEQPEQSDSPKSNTNDIQTVSEIINLGESRRLHGLLTGDVIEKETNASNAEILQSTMPKQFIQPSGKSNDYEEKFELLSKFSNKYSGQFSIYNLKYFQELVQANPPSHLLQCQFLNLTNDQTLQMLTNQRLITNGSQQILLYYTVNYFNATSGGGKKVTSNKETKKVGHNLQNQTSEIKERWKAEIKDTQQAILQTPSEADEKNNKEPKIFPPKRIVLGKKNKLNEMNDQQSNKSKQSVEVSENKVLWFPALKATSDISNDQNTITQKPLFKENLLSIRGVAKKNITHNDSIENKNLYVYNEKKSGKNELTKSKDPLKTTDDRNFAINHSRNLKDHTITNSGNWQGQKEWYALKDSPQIIEEEHVEYITEKVPVYITRTVPVIVKERRIITKSEIKKEMRPQFGSTINADLVKDELLSTMDEAKRLKADSSSRLLGREDDMYPDHSNN